MSGRCERCGDWFQCAEHSARYEAGGRWSDAPGPMERAIAEVRAKVRGRATIGPVDEYSRADVLKLAQRPFETDRDFYVHIAAVCLEQAARIDYRCRDGGNHKWGTDGAHSNVFCKVCFVSQEEVER